MAKNNAVVYHMLPRGHWEATPPDCPLTADTLASVGFIHCTAEPERLLQVANRFYRTTPGDWLILVVAPTRLTAPMYWEEADGHLFPHVYGPINRQAIVDVISFPREGENFLLPVQLSEQIA